jgi:transcription elongation factor Elf1
MQLKRRLGTFVEQLECLHCSHSRSFVLHGERAQRLVSQAEAARVAKQAVLTCGRCGSRSLIRSWTDAVPYATAAIVLRRRRRNHRPNQVQES